MDTKPALKMVLIFALAVPVLLGGVAGQEDVREKAAAAIRTGDHEAAVRLCLEGLRKNHTDYELNFLLGRAYAYSKRYDEALQQFDNLALAHPENTDILLFRARVKSWKHDYSKAEAGYGEVLRLNPGNSEALIGLAEVASWQGRYSESIVFYEQVREKDAANPDVYFRIGRVFLWAGNYDKARANFEKARSLDPRNKEYQRALKTATPRIRDQYELRTEYQMESFSDARKDYVDQRLALQLRLPKVGPLIFKANTTARYRARDYQYGFEFYPRLWSRAYAYIDAAFSPQAIYYPRTSFLTEIYQAVSSSWDASLGYRRMNFTAQAVDILLGSVGRYFGQTMAFLRWYYTPNSEGTAISWTLNLRRYFSDSNYIYAAYGRGSRPYDIVSMEDYSATRSWVVFAGLDWTIRQRIRIQFNYVYRNEGELRRNLLFIGAGYRW